MNASVDRTDTLRQLLGVGISKARSSQDIANETTGKVEHVSTGLLSLCLAQVCGSATLPTGCLVESGQAGMSGCADYSPKTGRKRDALHSVQPTYRTRGVRETATSTSLFTAAGEGGTAYRVWGGRRTGYVGGATAGASKP